MWRERVCERLRLLLVSVRTPDFHAKVKEAIFFQLPLAFTEFQNGEKKKRILLRR